MGSRLVVVVILVMLSVLLLLPRMASSDQRQKESNNQVQGLLESKKSPLARVEQIIVEAAIRHEIDSSRFLAVAKCESSLLPDVVGDGGHSVGLFQINLPSHPYVTKELASDPYWASEWSAKKFKENPRIWTCYQQLYSDSYGKQR